ncbi:MAG: adenylate cyclase [Alphaproteobacteria bacterium]|jgi:adenylate cyclase
MNVSIGEDDAVAGGLKARLLNRLRDAYHEEERQGLMLAIKVRSISLLVILVWQILEEPSFDLSALTDVAFILIFLTLGLSQYFLLATRHHPTWAPYLFILADCLILSFEFVRPELMQTGPSWSPAISLRGSSFVWYFMFLMQTTFSLRPRLVLWCGFSIVAARLGSVIWVLSNPGVFYKIEIADPSVENLVSIFFDPNFVSIDNLIQETIAVTLVAIGLAIVASRTQQFVENRATAERSRSNLARYFSPNMVDEISQSGGLDRTPQEQDIAILFTDIIGFTAICEVEPPGRVVEILRAYHDLLSSAVFRHNGTLDKYMGDGLMATFGTPRRGMHDATDALRCALELVENLTEWNEKRAHRGYPLIHVGVGLHFGTAVMGDIGDERHVEFAVIGDSVNVASRVEHLTRSLDASLVVSENLIAAVRQEDDGGETLIDALTDAGPQQIRGRKNRIGVRILPSNRPT